MSPPRGEQVRRMLHGLAKLAAVIIIAAGGVGSRVRPVEATSDGDSPDVPVTTGTGSASKPDSAVAQQTPPDRRQRPQRPRPSRRGPWACSWTSPMPSCTRRAPTGTRTPSRARHRARSRAEHRDSCPDPYAPDAARRSLANADRPQCRRARYTPGIDWSGRDGGCPALRDRRGGDAAHERAPGPRRGRRPDPLDTASSSAVQWEPRSRPDRAVAPRRQARASSILRR